MGLRYEDAMSMFEDWISRSGTTASLEANVDERGCNNSMYVSAHTRGMFNAFIAGFRDGRDVTDAVNESHTFAAVTVGKQGQKMSSASRCLDAALTALGRANSCDMPACPQCSAIDAIRDAQEILNGE